MLGISLQWASVCVWTPASAGPGSQESPGCVMIHREKENLYPIDSCTAPGLLEEKQSSESAASAGPGSQESPGCVMIHREKENLYPIDSCTAPGLLEEKQSSESAELMQTEMHHVRTLKIMADVYSKGLLKELQMEAQTVERIFPVLDDLLDLHTQLFSSLLERKKESREELGTEGREGGFVIRRIGDILVSQVRLQCRQSSQVRLQCRQSSQVRLQCRQSSQVRLQCRQCSQVRLQCRQSILEKQPGLLSSRGASSHCCRGKQCLLQS
ncbi:UNVERIFIED_CONTAM: hypothetical protein FKN15_025818 [Acipenser sinensis]